MPLKRKAAVSDGGDFELPPAGTFPAVCVAVILTGTHREQFPGNEPTEVSKIYLCWELLGEKNSKGHNFTIGREYTDSLHERANLRKVVDSWRGKALGKDEEFDFCVLAGKNCLITVAHTNPNSEGNVYANVNGVMKAMKGQQFDKSEHQPVIYDDIDPAKELPGQDWLYRIFGKTVSDRIKDSNEWKAKTKQAQAPSSNGSGSTKAPMPPGVPEEAEAAF